MANTNAPFGFRQIKGTGSAPTYEQNTRYIASANSTAIYFGDVEAYIIDDPNAQFEVQSSDSGGTAAVTFANVGEYINLAVGSGNTATGISGMTVNVATLNTTVTLPFRIVGLIQDPPGSNGTDIASEFNRVIVAFNNASTRTNGAGPTGLA